VFGRINTVPHSEDSHGEYKLERVESFIYLGTKVNIWNDISEEIKTRIITANRSCFGLQKHLKSRILSGTTKIQLFKTLVRFQVLTAVSMKFGVF
jgi:hypothetical protein